MLTPASDCSGSPCDHVDAVSDILAVCGVDRLDQFSDAASPRLRDILSPATAETDGCRSILAQLVAPFVGADAHDIAHHLHREFGSVNAVLAAHTSRLRRLLPQHAAVVEQIVRVADTLAHCRRLKLRRSTGEVSGHVLIDYLRHRIGFEPVEVVYALNFSIRGELLNDGIVARGTFDECRVMPNEIARGALDVGAAIVVIAHNHPSGDPTPSAADKRITREIERACSAIGVRLNDHIIIGTPEFVSFRELCLL